MRTNFGAKPWFYPLPVLIVGSYNPDGTADAMNAAWGGLYDADKVVLCLSRGHRTTSNILERKAFTVSVADEAILDEAGMIDPAKLKPLTFDPANGTYWSLGEKMGKAFSDGSQLK